MKYFALILILLSFPLFLNAQPSEVPHEQQYTKKDQYFKALSPEESIETIEVPDGYHIEVVASEPMVQEPASFVFDEDGSMYVCEWQTYMQDEYATGQKDKISRVVKLTDMDGDGKMDKRTVFIDNILLPRCILPMGDRVFVILTDSNSIWSYYDNDGDGVSDGRDLAWDGGAHTGNIEHQSSGLIWNLDNYIYNNYRRFKYENGKLIPDPHSVGRISQWGLTRDDDGRIYGSDAGAGIIAQNFQLPGGYPILPTQDVERGAEFNKPFAICRVEDQSSGGYDFENDHVLTHFSASCGQSVIRSGLLTAFNGSMASCEPVGRLIRLSHFRKENGVRKVYNYFGGSEFIRSTDPFFRPVWSESGPDGCFYFSDMYRGIIQEKAWFPHEGDHIWVKRYRRVKEWGMLKVYRHGRIYRLVPDNIKPQKVPKLLALKGQQLIPHLENENGTVRDNVQKLLVIRNDKSVIPDLKVFIKKTKNPAAKICALWALDGLGGTSPEIISSSLNDSSTQVQRAAVQLSEKYIHANHTTLTSKVESMKKSEDPDVRMQVFLAFDPIANTDLLPVRNRLEKELADMTLVKKYKEYESRKANMAKLDEVSQRGAKIYDSFCFSCHGNDGKGTKSPEGLLAPSLHKNRWLFQEKHKEVAAAIILKGESGSIDGKHYGEGVMIPMGNTYNDQQIADVISYIGKRWNHWGMAMKKEQVTSVRKAVAEQKAPFTQKELDALAIEFGTALPKYESDKADALKTLIVGGGGSHDFKRWFGREDGKTIFETGQTSVYYTEDTGSLANRLDEMDVLYISNNKAIPDESRKAVFKHINAGKGLMIIHPATWYNWQDWSVYNQKLVGGGCRSHEKIQEFEVIVKKADHPVMKGVPMTFRITDELYRWEKDPAAEIEILAIGRSLETGKEYPAIWTVKHPKAKIICNTLGHDGRAHQLPEYKTILKNSFLWVRK